MNTAKITREDVEIPDRATIFRLLEAHVRQRPGLDPRDYGGGRDGWADYRSEARSIQKDRAEFFELLAVAAVECNSEALVDGFRAYSGRLSLVKRPDGTWGLDYCTGQYWPTEYRAAACAVLASALWDTMRGRYAASARKSESPGDAIRRRFRERFGRGLASRWFN